MDTPTLTQFGFAGGAITAITMLWGQVKTIFTWVSGLVLERATYMDSAGSIVTRHLEKHGKPLRGMGGEYDVVTTYIRPMKKTAWAGYRIISRLKSNLIIYRGRILMLSPVAGDRNSPTSGQCVQITTLRGTINLKCLMEEAIDEANIGYVSGSFNRRFKTCRMCGLGSVHARGKGVSDGPGGLSSSKSEGVLTGIQWTRYQPDEIGDNRNLTNPFAIIARNNTSLAAGADAQSWFDARDWYESKGIAWRHGVAFYGPPGGGKTTHARAICQTLDVPVYSFDLVSMSNREFQDCWATAMASSPCCILLEDIDAVFHGRENISGEMGGGLTFDCLLNQISGIAENHGLLLIITANNPGLIDPALGVSTGVGNESTRPGRIDAVFQFGAATHEEKHWLAEKLTDSPTLAAQLADDSPADETIACFRARVEAVAVDRFKRQQAKQAHDMTNAYTPVIPTGRIPQTEIEKMLHDHRAARDRELDELLAPTT